jgi:hypothetical protein
VARKHGLGPYNAEVNPVSKKSKAKHKKAQEKDESFVLPFTALSGDEAEAEEGLGSSSSAAGVAMRASSSSGSSSSRHRSGREPCPISNKETYQIKEDDVASAINKSVATKKSALPFGQQVGRGAVCRKLGLKCSYTLPPATTPGVHN